MKPGSKGWKKFMAKLYGWGAAIVILGALFKIQHWPGAGIMLTIGLSTEAVIFFFSAFEPLHEEPDWGLVYPELNTGERSEHSDAIEDKGSITEQLDNMLEEARIEPELIASLGDGMRALSSQASKLNDISDASVATNEYVSNLRGASTRVAELSDSYAKASESLVGLTSQAEAGSSAGEHLQRMASNLTRLNQAYEAQFEELNKTKDLYSGIGELLSNLQDSVEDTRKYKENIAALSSNLASLNTVYGNMLSAMTINK